MGSSIPLGVTTRKSHLIRREILAISQVRPTVDVHLPIGFQVIVRRNRRIEFAAIQRLSESDAAVQEMHPQISQISQIRTTALNLRHL